MVRKVVSIPPSIRLQFFFYKFRVVIETLRGLPQPILVGLVGNSSITRDFYSIFMYEAMVERHISKPLNIDSNLRTQKRSLIEMTIRPGLLKTEAYSSGVSSKERDQTRTYPHTFFCNDRVC